MCMRDPRLVMIWPTLTAHEQHTFKQECLHLIHSTLLHGADENLYDSTWRKGVVFLICIFVNVICGEKWITPSIYAGYSQMTWTN